MRQPRIIYSYTESLKDRTGDKRTDPFIESLTRRVEKADKDMLVAVSARLAYYNKKKWVHNPYPLFEQVVDKIRERLLAEWPYAQAQKILPDPTKIPKVWLTRHGIKSSMKEVLRETKSSDPIEKFEREPLTTTHQNRPDIQHVLREIDEFFNKRFEISPSGDELGTEILSHGVERAESFLREYQVLDDQSIPSNQVLGLLSAKRENPHERMQTLQREAETKKGSHDNETRKWVQEKLGPETAQATLYGEYTPFKTALKLFKEAGIDVTDSDNLLRIKKMRYATYQIVWEGKKQAAKSLLKRELGDQTSGLVAAPIFKGVRPGVLNSLYYSGKKESEDKSSSLGLVVGVESPRGMNYRTHEVGGKLFLVINHTAYGLNNKRRIIDTAGSKVSKFYKEIKVLKNGFLVCEKKKWKFLNSELEETVQFEESIEHYIETPTGIIAAIPKGKKEDDTYELRDEVDTLIETLSASQVLDITPEGDGFNVVVRRDGNISMRNGKKEWSPEFPGEWIKTIPTPEGPVAVIKESEKSFKMIRIRDFEVLHESDKDLSHSGYIPGKGMYVHEWAGQIQYLESGRIDSGKDPASGKETRGGILQLGDHVVFKFSEKDHLEDGSLVYQKKSIRHVDLNTCKVVGTEENQRLLVKSQQPEGWIEIVTDKNLRELLRVREVIEVFSYRGNHSIIAKDFDNQVYQFDWEGHKIQHVSRDEILIEGKPGMSRQQELLKLMDNPNREAIDAYFEKYYGQVNYFAQAMSLFRNHLRKTPALMQKIRAEGKPKRLINPFRNRAVRSGNLSQKGWLTDLSYGIPLDARYSFDWLKDNWGKALFAIFAMFLLNQLLKNPHAITESWNQESTGDSYAEGAKRENGSPEGRGQKTKGQREKTQEEREAETQMAKRLKEIEGREGKEFYGEGGSGGSDNGGEAEATEAGKQGTGNGIAPASPVGEQNQNPDKQTQETEQPPETPWQEQLKEMLKELFKLLWHPENILVVLTLIYINKMIKKWRQKTFPNFEAEMQVQTLSIEGISALNSQGFHILLQEITNHMLYSQRAAHYGNWYEENQLKESLKALGTQIIQGTPKERISKTQLHESEAGALAFHQWIAENMVALQRRRMAERKAAKILESLVEQELTHFSQELGLTVPEIKHLASQVNLYTTQRETERKFQEEKLTWETKQEATKKEQEAKAKEPLLGIEIHGPGGRIL